MSSITLQTYASRASRQPNPAAKALLETIERKQSNLCVSVDVTNKQDLLDVCDAVGSDVCLIKTHIDIVEDFDMDLIQNLTELSKKHDFLIFEDRKFADVGNTVSLQYSSGVHKIASWSHITNAHLVPGPGIISGLAKVGQPLGRGCLLLAEMSSAGALTKGDYTKACVDEARKDETGFVCGFIAMSRVDEAEGQPNTGKDLLILTPGVGLDVKGDALGQQYQTPDQVIRENGCDVIIVGRGVYGSLTSEGKADRKAAFEKVREQGTRYKKAGWEAYLARIGQASTSKRVASEDMASTRRSTRRKLFAPDPPAPVTDEDAALAASLAAAEQQAAAGRYSLRRKASPPPATSSKRKGKAKASDSEDDSDFSSYEEEKAKVISTSPIKKGKTTTPLPTKKAKVTVSPFDASPRKKQKAIKVNLDESEAHPAPPHWEETYATLAKQRSKIIAPVDTLGCEENGREDRRADKDRIKESPEAEGRRERLSTLVSLMLSSQTKDPITAEAVYNLQRTLPGGLTLTSLLEASDETISSCIAKVGFWRRKTGYLKSAARILASDFDGDVPRTVDELCSLPGVGPKMAFLALSSMGIQVGIGVDTHVHRVTNRLGWHKTTNPEQTRLNLQSWLPQELHGKINKLLVGFGQVVCVPVGPRCDLCEIGKKGLCPSYREVDARSALKRVKVELLDSDDESQDRNDRWALDPGVKVEPRVKVEVEVPGPDGAGTIQTIVKTEEAAALEW